jgi:hypothetical protein
MSRASVVVGTLLERIVFYIFIDVVIAQNSHLPAKKVKFRGFTVHNFECPRAVEQYVPVYFTGVT